MTRERLLASTFAELAEALTDEVDVIDFLHRVTHRAAEILGAHAAGLILSDQRGRLRVVTSTSDAMAVLRLFSLASSDGPCQALFDTGRPVVNLDPVEAGRRWPQFVEAAARAGFASFHVLPMRVRSEVIGGLGLAYADHTAMDDDDLSIGEALTGVATVGLLQERTTRQKELLAEKLQDALNLRVMIEQAKGVVAERTGLDVDEAFPLMQQYAEETGMPLSEVASRALNGTLDLSDGAQPA